MNCVILLDGGAGRVFTAIPALEKIVKNRPNDHITILVNGWADLFWGNPILHDLVHYSDTKESLEFVLHSDELIIPEPYHCLDYIKGKLSLPQTFDLLINGSFEFPQNYKPKIYSSKREEISGMDVIKASKEHSGKQKVVVIQPFGSSAAETEHNTIIDSSNRSLELITYYHILEYFKQDYAFIYMGNLKTSDGVTTKPNCDMRTWYSIINECDYFIGCDSLGQHYAYSCDKPGTIIFGGTDPINVSYPHHFNCFTKPNTKINYSPLRIFGFGSYLSDIVNDKNMWYNEQDIQLMLNSINNHMLCEFKNNEKVNNECEKSNCTCN